MLDKKYILIFFFLKIEKCWKEKNYSIYLQCYFEKLSKNIKEMLMLIF